MKSIPEKLLKKLNERKINNALRSLTSPSNKIDFYSNDYLGFSQNKQIKLKAAQIMEQYATIQNGATGSRLLSGNHKLYSITEQQIAKFHNSPKALLFNSGYNANVGFFSCVPQRGDVVFYDEFIHASVRDGLLMNNAKKYNFKHNDLNNLREKINRIASKTIGVIYVVTESVFSMDGDSPDLIGLAKFCSKNNIYLIVDEAHALGIFGEKGQGLVSQLGIQNDVFAQTITFGKALGCHGAAILCSNDLYNYLINFARSLIYTTALPPEAIATISSGYLMLNDSKNKKIKKQLFLNIEYFNREASRFSLNKKIISSNSAIHCCLVSGNKEAKKIALELQSNGFEIKPILYPTVPKGQERLRICLHSYNTTSEITEILSIISKNLQLND